jgi:hypothetical protein
VEIRTHEFGKLIDMAVFFSATLIVAQGGAGKVMEKKDQDKWLDEALRALPIMQRARIESGRVVLNSLPMLRDVSTCLAYAVLLLVENRWSLKGRVSMCRYVGRGDNDVPHWFLDYELDRTGRLRRGTRRNFCSDQHANAFHQRQWRVRQLPAAQTITPNDNLRQPRR